MIIDVFVCRACVLECDVVWFRLFLPLLVCVCVNPVYVFLRCV